MRVWLDKTAVAVYAEWFLMFYRRYMVMVMNMGYGKRLQNNEVSETEISYCQPQKNIYLCKQWFTIKRTQRKEKTFYLLIS